MIHVLFFAKIREQLGVSNLTIELDELINISGANVGAVKMTDLMLLLKNRFPNYEDVFTKSTLIAINQEIVGDDHLVEGGDEVAFYPPVTGG